MHITSYLLLLENYSIHSKIVTKILFVCVLANVYQTLNHTVNSIVVTATKILAEMLQNLLCFIFGVPKDT